MASLFSSSESNGWNCDYVAKNFFYLSLEERGLTVASFWMMIGGFSDHKLRFVVEDTVRTDSYKTLYLWFFSMTKGNKKSQNRNYPSSALWHFNYDSLKVLAFGHCIRNQMMENEDLPYISNTLVFHYAVRHSTWKIHKLRWKKSRSYVCQ